MEPATMDRTGLPWTEGLLQRQSWDVAAISSARWRLQGALRHGTSAFRPKGGRRILLLTEQDPIPQAQIFPFYFFRGALAGRMPLQIREMPVQAFEAAPDAAPVDADVVFVQTWFDWPNGRIDKLFAELRVLHPSAKFVYLDWFAPTDLRLAEQVHPHVDLYVKKHLLRDRSQYGRPTIGDTNLVEYFGPAFGHQYPRVQHTIPEGFMKKLVVGPSFGTSSRLLPIFYHRSAPMQGPRTVGVHARLATGGEGWYRSMRQHAAEVAASLSNHTTLTGTGVPYARYMRELQSARSCFSPFGYGEVCWRDFEAIVSGALLLKPDMSHVETLPDLFVPDQTYVSLRWDLADFEDKVDWWLRHDTELQRVAAAAYARVREFSRGPAAVEHLISLVR